MHVSKKVFLYLNKLYKLPESLPSDQEAAIRHKDGPMLVLAGPGSGKTFVITHRIAHLITYEHINPTSILVITFTKAAAMEMQQRANLLIHDSSFVHFGTFHSIFYQILKKSTEYKHITLATDAERMTFLRDVFRHCYPKDELQVEKHVEACVREISIRKNAFRQQASNESTLPENNSKLAYHIKHTKDIKQENQTLRTKEMKETQLDAFQYHKEFEIYEAWLREHGLLDFDDMIRLCYQYLSTHLNALASYQQMFRYILIDEFQDINALQYEVIKLLAGHKNIFVVGDDDQSIYGFRGSNPKFMQTFLNDYSAKQILLKYNYRSQGAIVESALSLINHNQNRFYKDIEAKQEKIDDVELQMVASKRELSDLLCQKIAETKMQNPKATQAILLRTNAQKHFYQSFLKQHTMGPVEMDLLQYLCFINGGRKRSDFMQIMNKPMRYIPRAILLEAEVDFVRLRMRLSDKPWIAERITQFERQVEFIKQLDIVVQLRFIYKAMGYEDYAIEKYGKISAKQGFDQVASMILKQDMNDIIKQLGEKENMTQSQSGDVQIMTYHASKGLEFDCVYLPQLDYGTVPHGRVLTLDEIEEERRMFYVALTRAKKNVYLFCSENKTRSPFLDELICSEVSL